MAAMMFPSLSPTVALYARMTRRRGLSRPLLFASGYLLVWGAAGLAALRPVPARQWLFGGDLAWDAGGRWFAGGVLVVAALYELTPLKDVCLAKCRSPLGFLLGSWRDGRLGALEMGARHAGWCLGCCWALMAALFALGVMSLVWMAFVAALIALEKTLPWRRAVTWGTSAVLLALAIAVVAAPARRPRPGRPGRLGWRHADHGRDALARPRRGLRLDRGARSRAAGPAASRPARSRIRRPVPRDQVAVDREGRLARVVVA